jgi:transmembrane 9 superfamily protein 2/4
MGAFAGYYSARFYKLFQGKSWKANTLLTATLLPGTVFLCFFIINFFVWGAGSTAAVPFGTMFALLALWFGISVPLVFAGSYFGFKKPAYEMPVNFNQIPRQVPESPWYSHPWLLGLLTGFFPFTAGLFELSLVLDSIWRHNIYYVFGYMVITLISTSIVTCECAILQVYIKLVQEDYHWWWRSFLGPASTGVYFFVYSIWYFTMDLELTLGVSQLIYLGYMLVFSCLMAVFTGTLGFFACFFFVRVIYGSIKVD